MQTCESKRRREERGGGKRSRAETENVGGEVGEQRCTRNREANTLAVTRLQLTTCQVRHRHGLTDRVALRRGGRCTCRRKRTTRRALQCHPRRRGRCCARRRFDSRGAGIVWSVPRGDDARRNAVVLLAFSRGDDEDLNVSAPRDGPGGLLPDLNVRAPCHGPGWCLPGGVVSMGGANGAT